MEKPAQLRDLFSYEGRAELINGRVVVLPMMGMLPAQIKSEIICSLHEAAETLEGENEAFGGCLVYGVPKLKSGRESFCPDASLHRGPWPENESSWIPAAPTFAVEIRVLEDYSNPNVETERAAKRADYFEAGTLVVWDVDPIAQTVTKYTPAESKIFTVGEFADAEPAVPGWTMNLSDVFAES